MLDQNDNNLVVFLAAGGGCSLDSSPKKNWVERSGGLPSYICKIARAVMRSGKSKSSAIAIAVSRTKKWAAGGDSVDADTRAKAAKAVAQWEALKAKNKAKQVVKASREDGSDYLQLSNISSFNTETVRSAYSTMQQALRKAARIALKAQNPTTYDDNLATDEIPYNYIRELWTDYIIVESDNYGGGQHFAKIPYEVSNGSVIFGAPEEVEQTWTEVDDDDDDTLTDLEAALLGDVLILSKTQKSYLEIVAGMAQKK